MKNKLSVLVVLILLLFGQNSFSQQFNLEWEIKGNADYVGDMDGDGIGEFAVYSKDTTLFYDGITKNLKWTVTGKYFRSLWYQTGENPNTVFPSIDYDGDGIREILFSPVGSGGIIIANVVNNTNIFELSFPIDESVIYYQVYLQALADVDGDNELELVIRKELSTMHNGNIINEVVTYVYSTDISVSVVKEDIINTPSMFKLQQNYPNPFNPNTNIEYEIQKSGFATLRIYNSLGQLVKTLVNETKQDGRYSIIWNGRNDNGQIVSSGVYFYQLQVEDFVSSKRMILLK